jgi:hypothetical protein
MHRPPSPKEPCSSARWGTLFLWGLDRLNRGNANCSGGSVQDSDYLHALVEEVLRSLLIVKLIGGFVGDVRKYKFVLRLHDFSAERFDGTRVLIVRLHRLLLRSRIPQRVVRPLRKRRLAGETQSSTQSHRWQEHGQSELCFLHRSLLGGGICVSDTSDANALPTAGTRLKLLT